MCRASGLTPRATSRAISRSNPASGFTMCQDRRSIRARKSHVGTANAGSARKGKLERLGGGKRANDGRWPLQPAVIGSPCPLDMAEDCSTAWTAPMRAASTSMSRNWVLVIRIACMACVRWLSLAGGLRLVAHAPSFSVTRRSGSTRQRWFRHFSRFNDIVAHTVNYNLLSPACLRSEPDIQSQLRDGEF